MEEGAVRRAGRQHQREGELGVDIEESKKGGFSPSTCVSRGPEAPALQLLSDSGYEGIV